MPSKKRLAALFLILILSLLLSACSSNEKPAQTTIFAMDTYVTLQAYGKGAENAIQAATARLEEIENHISAFKRGTDIYTLNENSGKGYVPLSQDTFNILKESLDVSARTNGAFDPTVLPLSMLWNFKSQNPQVPSQAQIKALLPLVNYRQIKLDDKTKMARLSAYGMGIDLGGIGKGFAGDQLTALFKNSGIKSAVIQLGGNVSVVGARPDSKPWKIGINDPLDPGNNTVGYFEVTDCAVITSGDYERYFDKNGQRYFHILDPKTGMPARTNLHSVTIVSKKGSAGDALATALFVMGLDMALDYCKTDSDIITALFITSDKKIYLSNQNAVPFTFTAADRGYTLVQP